MFCGVCWLAKIHLQSIPTFVGNIFCFTSFYYFSTCRLGSLAACHSQRSGIQCKVRIRLEVDREVGGSRQEVEKRRLLLDS